MGVYIPNMKSMFKTCGDCPLDVPNCRLWEGLENLNTERHPNCPLIEIDLVRCGECKYHDEDGWGYGNCQRPYVDHLRTADEDFCSYGERRADE